MERMTIPDKEIEYGLKISVVDAKRIKENAMTLYWALKKYEDTGLTEEEIKKLKERDTEKKPDYEGDGYDSEGRIIYDTWICPNCGSRYEVDYDDYDFCPKCGQRLKWED